MRRINSLDELRALPSGAVVFADLMFATKSGDFWEYFGIDTIDRSEEYWEEFGAPSDPDFWTIQLVYTPEGGFENDRA